MPFPNELLVALGLKPAANFPPVAAKTVGSGDEWLGPDEWVGEGSAADWKREGRQRNGKAPNPVETVANLLKGFWDNRNFEESTEADRRVFAEAAQNPILPNALRMDQYFGGTQFEDALRSATGQLSEEDRYIRGQRGTRARPVPPGISRINQSGTGPAQSADMTNRLAVDLDQFNRPGTSYDMTNRLGIDLDQSGRPGWDELSNIFRLSGSYGGQPFGPGATMPGAGRAFDPQAGMGQPFDPQEQKHLERKKFEQLRAMGIIPDERVPIIDPSTGQPGRYNPMSAIPEPWAQPPSPDWLRESRGEFGSYYDDRTGLWYQSDPPIPAPELNAANEYARISAGDPVVGRGQPFDPQAGMGQPFDPVAGTGQPFDPQAGMGQPFDPQAGLGKEAFDPVDLTLTREGYFQKYPDRMRRDSRPEDLLHWDPSGRNYGINQFGGPEVDPYTGVPKGAYPAQGPYTGDRGMDAYPAQGPYTGDRGMDAYPAQGPYTGGRPPTQPLGPYTQAPTTQPGEAVDFTAPVGPYTGEPKSAYPAQGPYTGEQRDLGPYTGATY